LIERLVFEQIVIGIVEFESGAIGLGGLFFLANDGTGGSTGHEVELFVGVFARGMGWSMVSNENQRFLESMVGLAFVVESIFIIEIIVGGKGVLSEAREFFPSPCFGCFRGFAIGGFGGCSFLLGRFGFLGSRGEFLASFACRFAFATDFLDSLIEALDLMA
jgi:hypothetical protein